jgi:DNA-binding CsgD family transcriptional regulator
MGWPKTGRWKFFKCSNDLCGRRFRVWVTANMKRTPSYCCQRCAAMGSISRKKLTISRDGLKAALASGLTNRQICEQYGLKWPNGSSVAVAMKKFGLVDPRRTRSIRKPGLASYAEKMKALYENGHTTNELAVMFKCSQDTVLRHLRSAGTQMRKSGHQSKQRCSVSGCQRPAWKKPWSKWGGRCRFHENLAASEVAKKSYRKRFGLRPLCGKENRLGQPCKRLAPRGNTTCKWHREATLA